MSFVSKYCVGEKCHVKNCTSDAVAKVGEEIFDDDPFQARHNLTAYLCEPHFTLIMGHFGVAITDRMRQSWSSENVNARLAAISTIDTQTGRSFDATTSDPIPRRIRLDRMTPAELAIRDAVLAVETVGADTRLTNAVIKLQEARELVADYVDAMPSSSLVTETK